MKTLDFYMNLPYKMEIIPDSIEGGYVVKFPELPGCLTCCSSMSDIAAVSTDCKRQWLLAAMEDGSEIPEPTSADEFSGQFKLRLPKSLHKTLSEKSKEEGVSMNQYCVYLLTKNNSLYTK
ncbi:MAG: toxin-antitoxin system HicB family antitoxin [Ruminococcaceae bacterium]|nr:toxin-antitoxin system HicB family antitoxin [Oscillospiraceae bacterium]MBQ2916500.1 toxin-antitoxin system HicB family antitoxin [Clostridia bacterium]